MSFLYSWAFSKLMPKINVGTEDPYYEVTDTKAKNSKRKKLIPEGLSPNDAKLLKKFRKKAHRLDLAFECCCGCRVGWSGILQLIPWIGDIWASYLALRLIQMARKIDGGLPDSVYSKMFANVVFDFTVGLIPYVGALINIAYKCNSRNLLILEHYLVSNRNNSEIDWVELSGAVPGDQRTATNNPTYRNNPPYRGDPTTYQNDPPYRSDLNEKKAKAFTVSTTTDRQ
ncbi:hypothetical protein DASC09_025770 [Saccharomycopsis crataegensis]|uniref:Uncharacterized protein n=1 Tax=Saccharomycopsis crataegensis TaxID=43959 RepID=A0AAV5QKU6_9ASCO|nr:hypothetical protein DASC09_025770 [Saccharomycopsis crataegensis]